MSYRPIGGEHGPACDDGEREHMCDWCRTEADRDWIEPDWRPYSTSEVCS